MDELYDIYIVFEDDWGTLYEIQLSKGKYVTFENYTELKKTSYTTYGLSKGYAYGVRVRAYRTVKGKKVYGQFSTIKYVKLFDDCLY